MSASNKPSPDSDSTAPLSVSVILAGMGVYLLSVVVWIITACFCGVMGAWLGGWRQRQSDWDWSILLLLPLSFYGAPVVGTVIISILASCSRPVKECVEYSTGVVAVLSFLVSLLYYAFLKV